MSPFRIAKPFRTIGWRIFLSFSGLLVSVTLILCFVGVKFAQRTVYDNAANELRILSITLSGQVRRHLRRIESGLKTLSQPQGFLVSTLQNESYSQKQISEFIKNKLGQYTVFEAISVFDRSGTCLASTDSDWVGWRAPKASFFLQGLKHLGFAEIFSTPDDGIKVQLAFAPLTNGLEILGVVIAHVKLTSIYDLMDQQLGLRGNSEAFLLDSKLQFITPGKSAPDELLKSHLAQTPLVQHVKDELWVDRYKNYRGEEVLGTVLKLPGYNWYLVIERDYDEVKKQLTGIITVLIFASSGLLLALTLTSFFLTRSITRPIQALVGAAQKMAAGDLNQKLQIPAGTEEIDFLALEFDEMRKRLAAYQGRLIEKLELSEQKRTESERLAAIGTLASTLAHEIRNPLNAMSLLLSRLERSKSAEQAKGTMDGIRSEIGRLDRLITDILDYAKPVHLEKKRIEINSFIRSLLELYHAILEQKGLRCRFQPANSTLFVHADPDRIRQAMMNLIQNSIDAMENGGELEIIASNAKGNVAISIKDTGSGIPQDVKNRLFDLFFTTKEKGTGLGLSTVRKIIDAHGGDIRIGDSSTIGTTITLVLPIDSQV
ncbi:MAG: sensor histidine kinase [Deltaproteobacteria bacterium]|nr:sensor histidine kinase [Deltaproteobacteria bacterium]